MTKLTRLTNQRLRSHKQQSASQSGRLRQWLGNTLIVNLVTAGLVIVSGLTYLGMVNSTAANTFRVNALTEQIEFNTQRHTDLTLSISEIQSLQHLSAISANYQLVPVTQVEYVDTADAAVALSQ
ncbi:MAG: hypothetical protein HYV33_00885 [Candidatus Kerfeldbacteria bacterium]|nr:hypothetical protein [Candidatus Kerfeldbacteria bacterium]